MYEVLERETNLRTPAALQFFIFALTLSGVFTCVSACVSSSTTGDKSPVAEANARAYENAKAETISSSIGKSASAEEIPTRPTCLSIQEGDRHVEFNGQSLFLAESGSPKELKLDDGAPVHCDHLEIVRNAKRPSVLIEFSTEERGTSIGVFEKKYAVAQISGGTWVLAPLSLERHINDQDGIEVSELATVEWTEDKSGKAVLTVTDTESHAKSVYRP